MREPDRLRLGRGARGKLDERELARVRHPLQLARVGQVSHLADAQLGPRPGGGLSQEAADAAVRQHDARAAGTQKARGTPVELLEPGETHGRVERYRHRSREDRAEECVHEIDAGGKKDSDPIAGANAERGDRGGRAACAVMQFGDGEQLLALGAVEEGEADPLGRRAGAAHGCAIGARRCRRQCFADRRVPRQ